MKKLAIPLSLAVVAALAACGGPEATKTAYSEPATFVAPAAGGSLRTGPGKVVVLVDPAGPVDALSWQRMTLQMTDGSMQVVDRRGHQVAMGETVRVR